MGAFSVAVASCSCQGTRTGEHDALQGPEDSVWFSTLVTSRSCIIALPLMLAYNDCPLKFSSKEG